MGDTGVSSAPASHHSYPSPLGTILLLVRLTAGPAAES
jgi:hypothetical protein